MPDFTLSFWRTAAVIAAALFLVSAKLYAGARDELVDLRATAAANERAAKDTKASADITDKAAVKQVQSAKATEQAKNVVRRNVKEATHDEKNRTWAAVPVPDESWRVFREAVPPGSPPGSAAAVASGTLPGNTDTGKRH